MKSLKYLLYIFIIISLLSSCSFFKLFEDKPYTSALIILVNDSNKRECGIDSLDITYKISNVSTKTPQEVKVNLKPGARENINVTVKKGEYLNVKVYKTTDSTLLIEKKIKSGSGPNTWNDPITRSITFCDFKELKFVSF
jgi:hypothetical protein